MDGSQSIQENDLIVEVLQGKLLHVENVKTGERRAAHAGDLLLGHEVQIGSEMWILFEDGFSIRRNRLKEAWDDMTVEASRWDGNDKTGEFFEE